MIRSVRGGAALAALSFMLFACPKEESAADKPAAAEKPEAKPKDLSQDMGEGQAGMLPPPADVAAAPADAQKTPSGLAYKVLEKGTGEVHPKAWDTVSVHYTGWTTDGKMFDSSVARGEPTSFPLNRVIPGWTEGVQLMVVGEKTRFWIPEALAYRGQPGAPQGMLVFEVQLLEIKEGPKPIPAPPDVAAAPADAKKTASGLAYKQIQAGPGKKHPLATDRVKVHYTGWTTDGNMFDSSVQRGNPVVFPLNRVIPGWTEGVQLMTVGEKTRFWIPEGLAYAGRPGAPQGMLVFDVELIEIQESAKPPEVPKDVAAAPADAKKTASGLAYKVLEKGVGKAHPTAASRVQVHYTGWTTDGKMFDSSVVRGMPATFGLGQVIPGWTEGVQLMTVGEKTRFWIPESIAYAGQPGGPKGMLVFDIELLEIK